MVEEVTFTRQKQRLFLEQNRTAIHLLPRGLRWTFLQAVPPRPQLTQSLSPPQQLPSLLGLYLGSSAQEIMTVEQVSTRMLSPLL